MHIDQEVVNWTAVVWDDRVGPLLISMILMFESCRLATREPSGVGQTFPRTGDEKRSDPRSRSHNSRVHSRVCGLSDASATFRTICLPPATSQESRQMRSKGIVANNRPVSVSQRWRLVGPTS